MKALSSTHFLLSSLLMTGVSRLSAGAGDVFPAPYQRGNVTKTTKITRPNRVKPHFLFFIPSTYQPKIIFVSSHLFNFFLSTIHHSRSTDFLASQIRRSFILSLHHEGVAQKLMNAHDAYARHPVVHERRKRRPVDGADASQAVNAVFFHHLADGHSPRHDAAHPHFHIFIVAQS